MLRETLLHIPNLPNCILKQKIMKMQKNMPVCVLKVNADRLW